MRQSFLVGLFLFSTHFINAQINGVTESGDEVILYQDGTWKYLDESIIENNEIELNEESFVKDKKSTFLVKSTKLNIGIWINPKSWIFSKGKDNDVTEFQFKRKGEDLYGMLISEKVHIPIETLKGIALENARSAAPDIRIVHEEYRNVNEVKVLLMQMTGTINGIRFTYYGYYFSNTEGSIQLLAYTGENLFNNYLNDIEIFLNGFVEQ